MNSSVIILVRCRISTVLNNFFVFIDILYLGNHDCQSSLNIFLIADFKLFYAKSLIDEVHRQFLLAFFSFDWVVLSCFITGLVIFIFMKTGHLRLYTGVSLHAF